MSHTFPSPNPHPPNTYSLGEDEVLPSFDRRKETEKRKMTIRLKHDLIPACNKEGPTSEPSPQKPSKGILFNKSLPPSYLPFPRPTPTFSWPSHNPGLFCSWSQTSTISSTHHFLVGLVHTLSLMTFSHSLWHPHRNLKAAKPKAVAALQQAPHTHTGCWLLRPSTSQLIRMSHFWWSSASCSSSPLSNDSKKPELEGKNAKVCFRRAARYHPSNTPVMHTAKVSYDKKFHTEPYSVKGMTEESLMK